MKAALPSLAVMAAVAMAQERCDAPYPNVYCNTTEILAVKSSDCSPFHVFIARGSDEPYPGRQGNITREICKSIGSNDCSYEDIQYPAKSTAWGKDEWCKSAAKGATNGQAQMKAYSQKCPDAGLVLVGFSQGASVAQDILGGGGGKVFDCDQATNPALDESTGANVIAAVTFGAVIRSRDQNFTIGDGKNFDGRRARTPTQLSALNKYSDRLRDYCHHGDPMCAVGSEPADVYVHLNYFIEHNEEVTKWIAQKAKAGKGQSSPTTTTSAVAKSAAATPSIIGSATPQATDTSEAQSARTSGSSSSGNVNTGAASTMSVGYLMFVAAAMAAGLVAY